MKLGSFLCTLLLCWWLVGCTWVGLTIQPARAEIHVYPEAVSPQTASPETATISPAQSRTMYRSRLSLRDNRDQAWQVILFKRVRQGQVLEFKLRLVGFPEQVNLKHPSELVLRQGRTTVWTAADETELDQQLSAVTTSVGQYNVLEVMRSLDLPAPLELEITLMEGEVRSLLVPPYAVKEWLSLKDEGTLQQS